MREEGALLWRRGRGKDFAAAGFRLRFGFWRLLGFLAAFIFVSHAKKFAINGARRKERRMFVIQRGVFLLARAQLRAALLGFHVCTENRIHVREVAFAAGFEPVNYIAV